MTTGTFTHYALRTTEPAAAIAFYADLLGWSPSTTNPAQLLDGDRPVGSVEPLPDRARSLGAPAHWLGHLHVDAVQPMLERLRGRPLGPPRVTPTGTVQPIRDSIEAVVALSTVAHPEHLTVLWNELHCTDTEAAWRLYGETLGWSAEPAHPLPVGEGRYLPFRWRADGPIVGALADTARRPEVHVHWLYHFAVGDLDAAIERVRAGGGQVMHGPSHVAPHLRAAWCEDPQGAVFGLAQPEPSPP